MPSHVVERTATESERATLSRMLAEMPSGVARWKRAAESAFVMWCVILLLFMIAWWSVAWGVRRAIDVDYGWHSGASLSILGIALPLLAVCAIFSTVRWHRRWNDPSPALHADIEAGRIVEEHYVFQAAKRFQEPEHGGLIYFMQTPDNKTFTLFDLESQELGLADGDPLASKFGPMSRLVLVRAPRSGFVISSAFSGEMLDAGSPIELTAPPKAWPESERYCDISWSELAAVLSTG